MIQEITMEDLTFVESAIFVVVMLTGIIAQLAYTTSASDIGRNIDIDNMWTAVPLLCGHTVLALGGIIFGVWFALCVTLGIPTGL
jgi:hypothetical protein